MFEAIRNAVGKYFNDRSKSFVVVNNDLETIRHVNNAVAHYPPYSINQNAERYATSEDVYAIIELISSTCSSIPLFAYEVKNEKELKKLKQLNSNAPLHSHIIYEKKALEDLPESDWLAKLLEKPNGNQTGFEFREAYDKLMLIHGEVFLYLKRLEYGINAGRVVEVIPMLPQYVVMRVTSTYPLQIVSYDYVVDGFVVMANIPLEDVAHVKKFNPLAGYGVESLRGLSPLKALLKTFAEMDAAQDASVAQMQNGGVPGIVFEKSDDRTVAEDNGERKHRFYKYLTNKGNKGAPYFSYGDLGYLKLGLSTVDLGIIEKSKINFKKLCNAYGVSEVLLNDNSASTESNVFEMTKRLLTATALPHVQRMRDAFNMHVSNSDNTGKKRFINWDLSEIPELQQNQKELAEWLDKAWWLTPNEKRAAQKYDTDTENELMNDYIIPSGLQKLSAINGIDDLPLNDE